MPALPKFEYSLVEHLYDELELLELPVSGSLFDLIEFPSLKNEIVATDMHLHIGKQIVILGELITYKTVPTKNDQIMKFGSFLDKNNSFFDTVHFPKSLETSAFKGTGIYQIEGKITDEYGHYSIMVSWFTKLPIKSNPKLS